ncbi:MAG TPA: hypothetical protein VJJ46_08935 [Anaerolineales bacterium]|nr:hypothetical protein [Anaerolineales bacterium]
MRYFQGVPSPVRHPEEVDMAIFRENTEDIYAGLEFTSGSAGLQQSLGWLQKNLPDDYAKIRFPETSGA